MKLQWVFIDNNVFNNLTNQKTPREMAESIEAEIEREPSSNSITEWKGVFSAFTVMEALGITLDRSAYPPPTLSQQALLNVSIEFNEVFRHYENCLRGDQRFERDSIRKAAANQKRFLRQNEFAAKVYWDAVERWVETENISDLLCERIAGDLTQAHFHEQNPVTAQKRWQIIKDLYELTAEGRNVSFLRTAYYTAIDIKMRLMPAAGLTADREKEISETIKAAKLDTKKDFLDTELVHFSCLGFVTWGSKKLTNVYCFTQDDRDVVEARAKLYKGSIRKVKQLIEDQKLTTCVPKAATGKVIFLDKISGRFLSRLEL